MRLKAVGNGCLQSNPECLYLPTAICKQKVRNVFSYLHLQEEGLIKRDGESRLIYSF